MLHCWICKYSVCFFIPRKDKNVQQHYSQSCRQSRSRLCLVQFLKTREAVIRGTLSEDVPATGRQLCECIPVEHVLFAAVAVCLGGVVWLGGVCPGGVCSGGVSAQGGVYPSMY